MEEFAINDSDSVWVTVTFRTSTGKKICEPLRWATRNNNISWNRWHSPVKTTVTSLCKWQSGLVFQVWMKGKGVAAKSKVSNKVKAQCVQTIKKPKTNKLFNCCCLIWQTLVSSVGITKVLGNKLPEILSHRRDWPNAKVINWNILVIDKVLRQDTGQNGSQILCIPMGGQTNHTLSLPHPYLSLWSWTECRSVCLCVHEVSLYPKQCSLS